MLPAMVAAVMLARRGHAHVGRSRDRVRHTREADRCGDAAPGRRTCCGSGAARSGVADAVRRLPASRSCSWRMWFGPRQIAVLDRARQRVVRRTARPRPLLVVAMFVLMTVGWAACNAADPVDAAALVARPARARRRRRDQHRPLAVAPVRRGLGGGRPALLRSLLPAARAAARAARAAIALSRSVATRGDASRSRSRSSAGVMFSAAGYFLKPFGRGAGVPERSAGYLADALRHRRPRARVGQRARDLLGVGPASRRRATSPHRFALAGNHAGSHRGRRQPQRRSTRRSGRGSSATSTHTRRSYIVDTAPAAVRGADRSPMRVPAARRYVEEPLPPRPHDRRLRRLRAHLIASWPRTLVEARRTARPRTSIALARRSDQRPGDGVVAGVGGGEVAVAEELVGADRRAQPARAVRAARRARAPSGAVVEIGRRRGARRRAARRAPARRRSPRSPCAASTPGGT